MLRIIIRKVLSFFFVLHYLNEVTIILRILLIKIIRKVLYYFFIVFRSFKILLALVHLLQKFILARTLARHKFIFILASFATKKIDLLNKKYFIRVNES
jgi:hypothetical protein